MFEFLSQESIQNWPVVAVMFCYTCLPFMSIVMMIDARYNFSCLSAIADTDTCEIANISTGYRQLVGIAEAYEDNNVTAPFSKTPCLWYEYSSAKFLEGSGAEAGTWIENVAKSSEHKFLINDKTGRCIVAPKGADVKVLKTESWRSDPLTHGEAVETKPDTEKKMIYREKRIHSGDPIYVLGHVAPTVEREIEADGPPSTQQSISDNAVSYIVREGGNSKLPYIIASKSEGKVSEKYKSSVFASAFLSLASFVFFIWFLAARFEFKGVDLF